MEIKTQEPEYQESQSTETTIPQINTQTGNLTKLQPPMQPQEQWLKYGQQVSGFLGTLPDYVGKFFGQYQQPIVTIGLVVTSVVAVKVLLAVLDALNDIPLVAPSFELIGIAYSVWFIYRYLLKASSRQELSSEITTLKSQVVGKKTPES
ncbi:MAG: CAAD domain-containing protein [Dolichospermum sp.]